MVIDEWLKTLSSEDPFGCFSNGDKQKKVIMTSLARICNIDSKALNRDILNEFLRFYIYTVSRKINISADTLEYSPYTLISNPIKNIYHFTVLNKMKKNDVLRVEKKLRVK